MPPFSRPTLETFLYVRSLDPGSDPVRVEMADLVKRASVLEIGLDLHTFYSDVDSKIRPKIKALTANKTAEEAKLVIDELAKSVKVDLPFKVCWLAYSEGLNLPAAVTHGWRKSGNFPSNTEYYLVAHVAQKAGSIFSIIRIETGYNTVISHIKEYDKTAGWITPMLATPWVLSGIFETLNNSNSVKIKIDDPLYKKQFKLAAKRLKLNSEPAPYYQVKVSRRYIPDLTSTGIETDESVDELLTLRSHRWSVRGHHRSLVRRGPLPLSDSYKLLLTKRKYLVFTDYIDPEVAAFLENREVPAKGDSEWIAVRKLWVREHLRGPESAPFIPSTRVLKFQNHED